jgi:integrase
VHGAFFLAHAIFRWAVTQGYVAANAMVVAPGVLPRRSDKDPTWRATARFDPSEVAMLVSSSKLPFVRRVTNCVELLTGLRSGEASALRWCDYDAHKRPLGMIICGFAYSSALKARKETKAGVPRLIPVHPVLAGLLEQWKATGWREWTGRSPLADDLVIPRPDGTFRTNKQGREEFQADLGALGLRVRRHHDTRRTFISIALDQEASEARLRQITHRRRGDAFSMYDTAAWRALCRVVMRIELPGLWPSGGV